MKKRESVGAVHTYIHTTLIIGVEFFHTQKLINKQRQDKCTKQV